MLLGVGISCTISAIQEGGNKEVLVFKQPPATCVGVLHTVWEFFVLCGSSSYCVGVLHTVWKLFILCGNYSYCVGIIHTVWKLFILEIIHTVWELFILEIIHTVWELFILEIIHTVWELFILEIRKIHILDYTIFKKQSNFPVGTRTSVRRPKDVYFGRGDVR